MSESAPTRLSSLHLEDLAITALTAWPRHRAVELYPVLDDARRARLRSRLKLIGRHDWPTSLREDPLLRRGYTLRQCCRLIVALLLLDAHLPPSLAIAIAQNNELQFLRAMAARLRLAQEDAGGALPTDPVAVLILGELWEQVDEAGWRRATAARVRLVERAALSIIWDQGSDLGFAGQRLLIDAGAAAEAVWRWMNGRRLMLDEDRRELLADIDRQGSEPGFVERAHRVMRR